jgi:hypothetical protein
LFETVKSEPSIVAFGVMQLAVLLSGFFAALFAGLFVENAFSSQVRIATAVSSAAAAGIAGWIIARATRRYLREQTCVAWIWVIPSAVAILGFISEGVDDGLVFLAATCPAIASITYAVGFHFFARSGCSQD